MLDLRKLFLKPGDADGVVTELPHSHPPVARLAEEYAAIVRDQLGQGGIASGCVEVDVRPGGTGRDGRPILLAMLRIAQWDRRSGVRLLLGLPILESRVKRQVRAGWMADLAHFGGLWLHAGSQLQEAQVLKELRAAVVALDPPGGEDSRRGESLWSVSRDLE